MSGRANKLLNKTKKLEHKVRKQYNRINGLELHPEVTDITKKVEVDEFTDDNQELMNELTKLEQEEQLEGFSTKAKTVQRIDYSFPDENYGIELVVPIGIITASQLRSGDEVVFDSGALQGRSLEVIEVLNSTTLRLDDVSTFSGNENDVKIRFTVN